jgi:hypothetical protein
MANLFALLRDLGDHIANKRDGAGNRPYDNEAVESRFRSVLPNLLESYLVPFPGMQAFEHLIRVHLCVNLKCSLFQGCIIRLVCSRKGFEFKGLRVLIFKCTRHALILNSGEFSSHQYEERV